MDAKDLLTRWSNPNYWQKLCPDLTISTATSNHRGSAEEKYEPSERKELLQRIIDDGYALINATCCNSSMRAKIADAISDLETKHNLPATFILLFDETWHLASQSNHLLLPQNQTEGILRSHGKMSFNFDMLAWHIDPCKNQAGFSPHRDRQPDTTDALNQSFYPDGQAKYITHWIALADATPNNSCLYVIPKQFDPGYLEGDDPPEDSHEKLDTEEDNGNNNQTDSSKQFADPLTRALPNKRSYQNIRALPRMAGESLIFTHRILHWGSAGSPHYKNNKPRIAISFVYSDVDYEAPYLTNFSMQQGTVPPFSVRLLLVCSQLLIYHQRFSLSRMSIRACYDYCKAHNDDLNETYRTKVFVEFVKAMKEMRDGEQEEGVVADDNKATENGEDSEEEDAMLEAMLDNSGEFEDDFDDLECENENSRNKRARN